MINLLDNQELYKCGELYVQNCINFCKTLNKEKNVKYNIFLYWIGQNVNYKHSLVIKSFLTSQNIKNATLKIYSDIDLKKQEIFKPYVNLESIEFKIFDVYEEIKNTVFETNFKFVDDIKNHVYNIAYESDFFRILMLNKYGGVYIDFDVLLLRDLSPLLDYDFVYQWGCGESNLINGAIMHLKKNSNVNKLMASTLCNLDSKPGWGSLHWASDLYKKVHNQDKNLIILPACFFNSEWGLTTNEMKILDPLNEHKYSNKFIDGPFTWHWHNRWDEKINPNSKFDILDKIITKKFNEIRPITM